MRSNVHEWMVLAVIAGSLCAGCSENAPPAEAAASPPAAPSTASDEPTDLTSADVIIYLEAQGRTIGKVDETYAKMIGAKEGCRVEVDGHPFEIYSFEVQTDEGQLAFTKVKTQGIMGIEGETYGNLAFFRSTKDPHPEFLTLVESIRSMP